MQKRTFKDYICQTCNETFSSCKGYASRIPKFCSRACCAESLRKPKSEKVPTIKRKPGKKPQQPKEYKCLNCESLFTSKRECKTRAPKFCSKRCSALFVTDERREKMSAAKRGIVSWNKGVAMWADREHPRGGLGKKYPDRSGENSRFWRGGVSSENEIARSSPEYKEWRRKVFERDDYTCQMCQKRGGKLHADHIKPFAFFKELRFEISNGRTLCVECHYQTDTYGSKAMKFEGISINRIEQTANG